MASHEWPPPPPSLKSSSSRRKQLSRDALAAVDWHKPRRFESLSDDEDCLPSPHSRDPLESACQSSGKGAYCSSGYGDSKGFRSFVYSSNCNALQSSGYGDRNHIKHSANITCSNKEAKVKLPTNRRVDHASLAPHQNSAPLWLNACPCSGPLKLTAGRTHPSRSDMPVNKKSAFNPREPFSPQITCLGRVRVKENHGHNTDHSVSEGEDERDTHEVKKQIVIDRNKKESAEKRGCLARRKRREAVSAVATSETAATRRERAAALARSLTSLLEDLRKLEMEKESYEPAVPPPNSLLLMRGLGTGNKWRVQEITRICDEDDFLAKESASASDCENTINEALCWPGMKMNMERSAFAEQARIKEFVSRSVQREHEASQQALPLSEIKSNSLAQSISLSEPKSKVPVDCLKERPQELALWQRRAIAKLDAIDTKTPVKLPGIRPSTK
ncbi:hypothetical protein GOP47_0010814 [Adiantum capillus-veneris]|uniref:Uncharacterized protein n=1 Tax=Adiantum capillus-veneris TaxID=13818 RepID=A0A9D4UWK2_ADICA|nr:hypothetical protein GOP47_0010814 [Adiantum capillus-veneris]